MHIIDLSHLYTLVHVVGEKAESFLQGQLTCDVREVSPTQARLSAHCNPKGRVLSSFRLLKKEAVFSLHAPNNMAEDIIRQLMPYARLSRVALEISQASTLGIWGENAVTKLSSYFEKLPQTADEMVTENAISLIRLPGDFTRFIAIGHQDTINQLREIYSETITEDTQAWYLLDIQSNVATIQPKTSALFTPHMVGYPALNAVSFKKGCYIGQEVIARTEYLGKAKRHLYRAKVISSQTPQPGDALVDNAQNEMGIVVNSAFNADKKYHECLAVIQDQALSNELYWGTEKEIVECHSP
ncbi:MAG: hypothetical protein K0Q74_1307 [Gammaproteobacteria bacterium]|nr:hypothetical protein [Gammaproteobacteria bacterium]